MGWREFNVLLNKTLRKIKRIEKIAKYFGEDIDYYISSFYIFSNEEGKSMNGFNKKIKKYFISVLLRLVNMYKKDINIFYHSFVYFPEKDTRLISSFVDGAKDALKNSISLPSEEKILLELITKIKKNSSYCLGQYKKSSTEMKEKFIIGVNDYLKGEKEQTAKERVNRWFMMTDLLRDLIPPEKVKKI